MRPGRALGLLIGGLSLVVLLGCEAKPDLSRVDTERARITKRFDQFQGLARTADVIVAVGARGAVVASDDGGKTWRRENLRIPDTITTPTLIGVTACPDGRLVALDAGRRVWISEDAARTWTAKDLPTPENPMALTCDPGGRIWVVASFSTILTSADNGESWSQTSFDDDLMFTTIQFLDAKQGVITGEFGAVLTTLDGGATWNRDHVIPNEFYPQGAYFATLDEGWVAGLNGAILYTRDGGAHWTHETTGVGVPLYAFAVDGERLYALGGFGTVIARTGNTWQAIPERAGPAYLRAALFLDDGRLLVAGGAGTLRTVSVDRAAAVPAERNENGKGRQASP